jgi:hypothetical protein
LFLSVFLFPLFLFRFLLNPTSPENFLFSFIFCLYHKHKQKRLSIIVAIGFIDTYPSRRYLLTPWIDAICHSIQVILHTRPNRVAHIYHHTIGLPQISITEAIMMTPKHQHKPYISPQSDDTAFSITNVKSFLSTPTKQFAPNWPHKNTGINTLSSSPPPHPSQYSDNEDNGERPFIYKDPVPQPVCPSSPVPHNVLEEIAILQPPLTPRTESTLFHHSSSVSAHKTHVDPVMLFHNKTMGGFNTWSIPLATLSSSPPPQGRPSPSTPKTFSNIIYSSPLYQGFRSSPVHGNSPSSIPQLLPYTFKPSKKPSPIRQQAKTLSKALDFENLVKRKQADPRFRQRSKKKRKIHRVSKQEPSGTTASLYLKRRSFLESRRLKYQSSKLKSPVSVKKSLLVRVDVNSKGQAIIVKAMVPVEDDESVKRFSIREYQSSDDEDEDQSECGPSEEETKNDFEVSSMAVPNLTHISISPSSTSSVSPCMDRPFRKMGSPLSSPYQTPNKLAFPPIKRSIPTNGNLDLVFPKLNSPFAAGKQRNQSKKKVMFEALSREELVSESELEEESDGSCKLDARDALRNLMISSRNLAKATPIAAPVVAKPNFQLPPIRISGSLTPHRTQCTGSSSNNNSFGSSHRMLSSSPGFDDFVFQTFVSLSPTTK